MPRFVFASLIVLIAVSSGCASRRGWGFPWGQGTVDRQESRAVVHDPYPLNDIGPEVDGGRPRGFTNPLSEHNRQQFTQPALDWNYPGQ